MKEQKLTSIVCILAAFILMAANHQAVSAVVVVVAIANYAFIEWLESRSTTDSGRLRDEIEALKNRLDAYDLNRRMR